MHGCAEAARNLLRQAVGPDGGPPNCLNSAARKSRSDAGSSSEAIDG